ncbi:MAG TPA: GIY-YIG nuclease family protein, partial [Rubricoccaceae bacterium]|nr:GIY-YIG nuclease family protein [Rubricoccaceae bacterium]
MRRYWVYILTNHARTLYTGVTNDLVRRACEHKAGEGSVFTRRYRINQLVFYASFSSVRDAIRREKEIKGWTREKKLALIEARNAGWLDLAAGLGEGSVPPPNPQSRHPERSEESEASRRSSTST